MNILENNSGIFSAHRIFSALTESEASEIASHMDTLFADTGQIIFSSGDEARAMYIVVSGKISVLKTDDYGNQREIAKIVTGDNLGEIDMITGTPYSVTAIAEMPTNLLLFPPRPWTLQKYLEQNPAVGSKILYSFISDIAERTRTANELLKDNSPHIRELRRQIYEDKLTFLFNKTFLEENLPLLLRGKENSVSLLMIKPDNFKRVNDVAGHEAGDNLLVHLAALLPSCLPENAILVRFIGNEFALMMPDTDAPAAEKTAETIRHFYNTLDVTKYLPEEGFHLTVSVGIAVFPVHAKDAAGLIDQAHQLPLIGRERGGNLILFPEAITERRI
jgi:diguanylate cyclase (GGDEF)-like protein